MLFKAHFANSKVFESSLIQSSFAQINKKNCPDVFFDAKSILFCDSVKIGGFLDCEHEFDPTKIWPAQIVARFGGLLSLKWYGATSNATFILHSADRRIHPLHSGTKIDRAYSVPCRISSPKTPVFKNLVPAFDESVYPPAKEVRRHEFKKGWRLEVVDPISQGSFRPGIVSRIFNDEYFLVEVGGSCHFVAHATSPLIAPVSTSLLKGVFFTPPENWSSNKPFTWTSFLINEFSSDSIVSSISTCNGREILNLENCIAHLENHNLACCPDEYFFKGVQPDTKKRDVEPPPKQTLAEFFLGMKLEMMLQHNSLRKHGFPPICSATVVRVRGRLLWLLPDSVPDEETPRPLLVEASSCYIFPIGWAHFNNYPNFIYPPFYISRQALQGEFHLSVYVNASCFSGSFLSKDQVPKLPKVIGPGPIRLVLQHLLNLLIGASVKPIRTLRLFECDWLNTLAKYTNLVESRRTGLDLVLLHSPSAGRNNFKIEAMAEVARYPRAVEEFCRQVALSLEACPYFLTLESMDRYRRDTGDCPCKCKTRIESKAYERIPSWRKRLQITFNSNHVFASSTKSSLSQHDQNRIDPTQDLLPSLFRVQASSMCLSPPSSMIDLTSPFVSSSRTQEGSSKSTGVKRILRARTVQPSITKPEEPVSAPLAKKSRLENGNSTKSLACLPVYSSTYYEEVNCLAEHSSSFTSESAHVMQFCDIPQIQLTSNPMHWTPTDVANYVRKTDCSRLWNSLENECVDGSAFMLLTLPVLHKVVGMRWADAIRMSRHVTAVKNAYLKQFSRDDPNDIIVQSMKREQSCSDDAKSRPRAKKRQSSISTRNGKELSSNPIQ
ncbi:Scm-like with four MBT domains protein 2 [Cichlidogyrus casuarinus]|uniref:Scm-like with four MBT domains protein 2 n=1 Tax=Cichlidogyrus casuarinus TaxID=1844966 RepID=A0ABD2QJ68_9PLAT